MQHNVPHLTELEKQTLDDLILGLTDKAIARKRSLTVRGVQNRLSSVATKLLGQKHGQMSAGMEFYNLRVRIMFEALRLGLYSIEDIAELEKSLNFWLQAVSAAPDSTVGAINSHLAATC